MAFHGVEEGVDPLLYTRHFPNLKQTLEWTFSRWVLDIREDVQGTIVWKDEVDGWE